MGFDHDSEIHDFLEDVGSPATRQSVVMTVNIDKDLHQSHKHFHQMDEISCAVAGVPHLRVRSDVRMFCSEQLFSCLMFLQFSVGCSLISIPDVACFFLDLICRCDIFHVLNVVLLQSMWSSWDVFWFSVSFTEC